MLCDWLVVSQVLPVNPAAAVRGPKHVVTKGATPVLTPAEARKLLEHVAAYIRTHPGPVPTVKQHLAAIRMLCDWLVVSQVLPANPAAAVRGPKHVVTKGSTPVLSPAEARKLLDCIDTGSLAGLRDRALLSVMLYSFARVSAVLGMRRQDYFRQGSRGWLRLHEKGGKRHDVPAHHRAAEALDEHLEASGLEDGRAALFQSVDRVGDRLTGRSLTRRVVLAMIKRRAATVALPPSTCCHTFRGDGDNGVSVERGDPRARAADRRARVAEDDEALRPHGGHGDHRRDAAFRALQAEMDEQIRTRLDDTRRALFEHFDEDVHQRLRLQLADAQARLDHVGGRFWSLTRFMLDGRARFDEASLAFDLEHPPRT